MIKYCNIQDIESIVLVKQEIEKYLLESNKISQKYSIEDFISKVISKTEYIYTYFNKNTDKMNSFILYEINNIHYVFNIDVDDNILEKLVHYATIFDSLQDITNTWAADDNITDMLINNMKYGKISIS